MTFDRAAFIRWNLGIQRSIDAYHERPIRACLEEDCPTPCHYAAELCTFHARWAPA